MASAALTIKTDETHLRSRKPFEKMGVWSEGISEKLKSKASGEFRNAAYYSLPDDKCVDAEIEFPLLKR
jgi:hypothetical protein